MQDIAMELKILFCTLAIFFSGMYAGYNLGIENVLNRMKKDIQKIDQYFQYLDSEEIRKIDPDEITMEYIDKILNSGPNDPENK